MGCAPRNVRRTSLVSSADHHGNARVQRSENPRGTPETETELLPGEPALQQLVMHIGSRTASRLGIPDALGQQTHRRSRSHRARARTDEPPQRTRLTHMAGLSVNSLIAEY